MNVMELGLWPAARRTRFDQEVDLIDVKTAFRQIAIELHRLYDIDNKVVVYNAATCKHEEYVIILVGLYGDSPAT
jgi:hypothetical protein